MANRTKGPGKRARKRRPNRASQASKAQGSESIQVQEGAAARSSGPGTAPLSTTFGERPLPPWHPLPLSELLILVGAIAAVIGFLRAAKPGGLSHGGPPLLAGILAVLVGTLEVTAREHFSGYRSHTIILAALPVIVLQTVLVLGVAALTPFPALLNIALLALDAALFIVLYRFLRTRFLNARTRRISRR